LDFETTHETHQTLCHVCDELRTKSYSKSMKKKIVEKCLGEKHPKPPSSLCEGCMKDYHTAVASKQCNHAKMEYVRDGVKHVFSICDGCHTEVKSKIECNHSKSEILTNLEPISYNFKIVDNTQSERKVWFNKTYSAVKRKDLSPVKHFYRVLNQIKEDIYHAITPREEMNLSEEEQIKFEEAQKCYVCAEKFGLNKHNLKNRDHCHKTGYVLLVNY